MKLTKTDGKFLIKLARSAITAKLAGKIPKKPAKYNKKFDQNLGVFVTLNTYFDKELRGCIGYPEPVAPLIDAVMDSAINAATHDPRFPPITANELSSILIEVSVLTPPELVKVKKPEEYPSKIEVGKDGLIVEWNFYKGLLLPQVATEWSWSAEEFLRHTCNKAGLEPDAWKTKPNFKLYKFQGKIFAEEGPGGEVVEKQ